MNGSPYIATLKHRYVVADYNQYSPGDADYQGHSLSEDLPSFLFRSEGGRNSLEDLIVSQLVTNPARSAGAGLRWCSWPSFGR